MPHVFVFLSCSPFQTFLYLCWYLIMSLLGHYNNFFFACHLLDIAMGVKTLRTILSSVTHNGKQVPPQQGKLSGLHRADLYCGALADSRSLV